MNIGNATGPSAASLKLIAASEEGGGGVTMDGLSKSKFDPCGVLSRICCVTACTRGRFTEELGCCCRCHNRRLRMILRRARAVRRRRTSSPIAWPRSLWCHFTKGAGHRSHKCSADSISSSRKRQIASLDIPTKCCQRRRVG